MSSFLLRLQRISSKVSASAASIAQSRRVFSTSVYRCLQQPPGGGPGSRRNVLNFQPGQMKVNKIEPMKSPDSGGPTMGGIGVTLSMLLWASISAYQNMLGCGTMINSMQGPEAVAELPRFITAHEAEAKVKEGAFDKWRASYHRYGCHLSDRVRRLFIEVQEDANLEMDERDKFKAFAADSFTPLVNGNMGNVLVGCVMGLPRYFEYESVDDVGDFSKLRHIWKYIVAFKSLIRRLQMRDELYIKRNNDPDSKEIAELKETLVLSDEAVKAAILFHYPQTNQFNVIFYTISPLIFLFGVFTLWFDFVKSPKFHSVPLVPKLSMAAMALTSLGLLLMFSYLNLEQKEVNDGFEKIFETGDENYIRGAREYFTKMEKRGHLLRNLLEFGDSLILEKNGEFDPYIFGRAKGSEPLIKLFEEKLKNFQKAAKESQFQSKLTK